MASEFLFHLPSAKGEKSPSNWEPQGRMAHLIRRAEGIEILRSALNEEKNPEMQRHNFNLLAEATCIC